LGGRFPANLYDFWLSQDQIDSTRDAGATMFFPTLPFLPWSANKLAATAIFVGKGAKLRGFASHDEVAALQK
jgi:hypothetical protein